MYDTPGNTRDVTKAVLAAYPESLARSTPGVLDPNGDPLVANVVKSCNAAGTCAYYQYLQGTSMASPHAVGVAALIVSKYGYHDRRNGGLTLLPGVTEWILRVTATDTPCPVPPAFTYTRHPAERCHGHGDPRLRGSTLGQRLLRQRHHQRQPGGRPLAPEPRDSFREFSRGRYLGGLWTITYTTRGDTP